MSKTVEELMQQIDRLILLVDDCQKRQERLIVLLEKYFANQYPKVI